ncbi:MAG: hypothetical protein J6S60_03890 [Oscillospiraceae bacterium]|nr:hypothetical protein [Oscillospiraceae bacterium]
MPNRILKETIHTSESVNRMTDFQFRLWINLIVYVDDYGRGDARPAVIRGTCFPLRDRITNRDIDAALRALADIGCVGLYSVDGRPYLYLPAWESHQTVRNKRSRFPAPENADPQDDPQAFASNCNQMKSTACKCARNPIQSESNPNPNPRENARARGRFGEYKNVLLTDEDMEKLKTEFPQDWQARIDNLSAYMRGSGRTYKDHLAVIRTWARKDAERGQSRPTRTNPALDYTQRSYTEDELSRILYDPAQDFS